MIWLIDYTHYQRDIDPRLAECKKQYFRLKNYVRYNKIGPTAPTKSRVFGTGLLRLATIMHKNGVEVRYLHYYMLKEALCTAECLPEKIAFSALCPTIPACAELAQYIKAQFPNIKVVIGGVHVNLNPELTHQRFPIFDELIVGYEHDAAEKIAGCKLTAVPYPYVDYSLLPLPLSEYAINTFTTMGCPFKCAYCVDGRAPHFCASDDGQIEELKKLLPKRNLVHFFDSVLGYSKEGILRVCAALKRSKHEFLLSCDMRADILTPELVKELEEAGFVEIRLGLESVDPEILDRNERTLHVNKFLEQIKMIRSCSNLYITLYSITGIPGTDRKTQQATLDFCEELFKDKLVDEIKNALYVPYPMSGVNYADRGIMLLSENWEDYDRQSFPVFETDKLSAEELWELYIYTAESINQSWLKGLGFESFDDVPKIDGYYNEYIEANYLKES
jgi:radical SAM superfamily enzyme YgiQ (UPF0313 family)